MKANRPSWQLDLAGSQFHQVCGSQTQTSAPPIHVSDLHVTPAAGENVKEFFFRVASLAFETNVLAELEKSGPRQIGDVVSECLVLDFVGNVTRCLIVLTPCWASFFRNQQQFQPSVHPVEEEAVKLLSVRVEASVFKGKSRTENEEFSQWKKTVRAGRGTLQTLVETVGVCFFPGLKQFPPSGILVLLLSLSDIAITYNAKE